MSLFEDETEKLKRNQRFMEYQHGQDVAELNRKLEDKMQEASEYVDAESSEMMSKIEALEKDVAELKRQIDGLKAKT
jgi:uncharacterized protein YceH (UPF0502 family)